MFSFFRSKKFEPNFPIIGLESSPEEVFEALSKFSSVTKDDCKENEEIDFSYVSETDETRIHVGFVNDKISYVNYLSSLFNSNDKQKAQKLKWFLDYYGGEDEFDEPQDTGYMVFCRNPYRNLTIVLGLHMGPIRINQH